MSKTNHIFEELPVLLSWKDDPGIGDRLQLILAGHTGRLLTDFLRRLAEGERVKAESLQGRLRQLPFDTALSLVTAPQVYYLLAHGDDLTATSDFLGDALTAAEGRGGGGARGAGGVWTAVGDYYLPPDASAMHARGVTEWSPDRAFRAPTLSNGMAVDFHSPFTRGSLPEVSGDDVPMTSEERRDTLEKVERAVSGLAAACPRAGDFLKRFSKVIVVRKDSGPTRYTSASTCLCIGRPILRNPHLPEANPESIADGLVHETIHGVLDIVELETPMITNKEAAEARIPSGWTGRSLDLNTYLQACHVWYGLWNLWCSALGGDHFDRTRVLALMSVASRGFTGPGIVKPLGPVLGALHPSLLSSLEAAQENVRSDMALIEQAYASYVA